MVDGDDDDDEGDINEAGDSIDDGCEIRTSDDGEPSRLRIDLPDLGLVDSDIAPV